MLAWGGSTKYQEKNKEICWPSFFVFTKNTIFVFLQFLFFSLTVGSSKFGEKTDVNSLHMCFKFESRDSKGSEVIRGKGSEIYRK